MDNKLIVANNNNCKFICLLDEFDHMVECHPFSDATKSSVGNIYIGVVKKKVKGIGGYFVDYGEEKNGFLPITPSTNTFSPGQSIVVQIKKDAYGTKGAKLSTTLSISGNYFVLVNDTTEIHFSSKLPEDARTKGIKSIVAKYKNKEYGFIVRTNCYNAINSEFEQELNSLIETYNHIQDIKGYRPNYNMLYNNNNGWIKYVQDMNKANLLEIHVDCEEDKSIITSYLTKIGLHNEITVNLIDKLFSIFDVSDKLNKSHLKNIWLASGGSIVIDKTEAMIIIDVNSGKNIKKINTHRNRLKINKEAAKEAMKQVRLRNLSGIILIDFIDMDIEDDNKTLLSYIKSISQTDPIRVVVHGLTRLGIMEITRKRLEPSLREQLKNIGYIPSK